MISDIDINIGQANIRSFADDTRTSSKIHTLNDVSKLQNDLNVIYSWTEQNNMKLNDLKFEALRYGNDEVLKLCTYYYTPSGSIINNKHEVKDLGVIMDDDCMFKSQINSIVEKGKQLSSWILRSFNCRNRNTKLTLWKTIVLPTIEYGSVLWAPSKISQIQGIENIQWYFVRKIKGTINLNYWQILTKFKLYSLQRHRERYMIIYIWKILESMVPNVGNSVIYDYHPPHGRKCVIKLTNRNRFSTILDKQVTVHGVKLFNIIPRSIRDLTGVKIECFKTSLDTFLGKIPDEPPATGHSSNKGGRTNSLLDVIPSWNIDNGRAFHHSS